MKYTISQSTKHRLNNKQTIQSNPPIKEQHPLILFAPQYIIPQPNNLSNELYTI